MKKLQQNEFKFLEYLDSHGPKDRYTEIADLLFDKHAIDAALEHENAQMKTDYGDSKRRPFYELTSSGYSNLISVKTNESNKRIGLATLYITAISLFVTILSLVFQFFNSAP